MEHHLGKSQIWFQNMTHTSNIIHQNRCPYGPQFTKHVFQGDSPVRFIALKMVMFGLPLVTIPGLLAP
jgi:hypothetical protein